VLTRTLTDAKGNVSIWKYDTTAVAYATVVTDPSSNDTVHTFSPTGSGTRTNYETLTQVYQGSHTGTGLLRTNTICYNANFSNCPTANVPHVITQKDVYTALPGKAQQSQSEITYDLLGQVTEDKEYDFGSVLVSDHVITRGTCSEISNRVCTDVLKNGSGTVVAQINNTYDSFGNLLTSARLTSGTTYLTKSFTYNSNGTVKVATDLNGAQTTYGSYTCNSNFATTVSEPLSLSESMTWDCNGGVQTSLTDENAAVTTTNYKIGSTADPFYRPLSIVDPLLNTTGFTYPSPTTSESAMNFNGTLSTTDVLTTTDGLGRNMFAQKRQSQTSTYFDSTQTTYSWNSTGLFTTQTVPYSGTAAQPAPNGTAVTTVQYDALGRPITITDGGGGTTAYTYPQNDVLVITGPTQNFQKQLEYDGLGRLTSVCEITSASGSGSCGQSNSKTGFLTKYSYDALANLLTVTQNAQPGAIGGAQTRAYVYDGLKRLKSESNPETSNTGTNGTIAYTYDTDSTCGTTSNGDLVKKVDAASNVICYTRDALHRVSGMTYPSGPYSASTPSKTLVYDATTFSCTYPNVKGRLAEAFTGPSSAKITDIAYCYSARGETTDAFESTPNSGSMPYHTVASYWANGALYTLGGVPQHNTWTFGTLDGEGRPISAVDGTSTTLVNATGTAYNVAGQPSSVSLGSGDSDAYTYDPNTGRIATYQYNVGSPAQVVKGTLGWNSNWTLGSLLIADAFNKANTQNCGYSYDDLSRLQSVSCGPKNQDGTTWGQTFAYDPFGNISKSVPRTMTGISWLPGYNTNNQYTLGGTSYDGNGNLKADTFNTYAWDADGNTVGVNLNGTAPIGITYDALDRAVEENNSGTYKQILYSPTGGKLALMATQAASNVFLPLPGGEQATYTAQTIRFRHYDWLGSARFESNMAEKEYGDVAYAPFGEPYSVLNTPYLSFTGQQQDTISGTYDFLNREYNPVQGRWIRPDPAGVNAVNPMNPQSWNRYAYVLNNPLSNIDPTGLECVWDDGSYDSNDDPDTGSPISCGNAGGNWVDHSYFEQNGLADWSGGPNSDIANYAANNTLSQKICSAIPSGRTTGASGGVGGVGSPGGGGELVVNYNTGQVSAFAFGGLQVGWNGGVSGSVYTGFVWGLNGSNSNYSGGFTGVNGGAGLGGFAESSSGGLTGGTSGLAPNGNVNAAGISLGGGLLGGFSGGVTATNYSNPAQLGKFWGFGLNPVDWLLYAARQVCK
jgi:RHS repeat-associated protein